VTDRRWIVRGWLLVGLCLCALASTARADAYVVVEGDRSAFEALLSIDGASTIIDSHSAFAADPVAGSTASLLRSGTVAGAVFSYIASDVDFAATAPGFLSPGSVGGDVLDLDSVFVELPVAQSGAVGVASWGLDSGSGSTSGPNALLVHFSVTPGGAGIGHFGVDLLDFEANGAFTAGQLRLYDDGLLVFAAPLDFGVGAGNGVSRFVGVAANTAEGGLLFDSVALVLGDDGLGGGRFERWAAESITFGRAITNPEPGTWALLGLGLCGLLAGAGRRRQRRRDV